MRARPLASALLILLLTLAVRSVSTAEEFATILGTLTAEDTGSGLNGYKVRAMPGDFRAMTNEKGVFALKGLMPGGTYALSFFRESSPYVNEFSSVEVAIPDNRFIVTINHSLAPGASVSGTVYDSRGMIPLSGAAVSVIVPESPAMDEAFMLARTDDDGNYLIQGLTASDDCTVSVAVYGHAWVERKVRLVGGETVGDVDFIIGWDDITGVNGSVRSSEGNAPLVNARVSLIDDTGRTAGIALTTEEGAYSIVGVKPGTYMVTASRGGIRIINDDVTVRAGESTRLDFSLDAAPPKGEDEEAGGAGGEEDDDF